MLVLSKDRIRFIAPISALSPTGEKHWHGGTGTTVMTHIAIQEQLDGKTVNSMEKVSDEQYKGKSDVDKR